MSILFSIIDFSAWCDEIGSIFQTIEESAQHQIDFLMGSVGIQQANTEKDVFSWPSASAQFQSISVITQKTNSLR